MERLTDKRMSGEGFIPVDPKEYKAFVRNEKPTGKQIYQRLLEIEDILGDTYDLDHLRELVEADKDGRCVVLPCKVGDKIWFTRAWYSKEAHPIAGKVTGIRGISEGYVLFSAVVEEEGPAKGSARRFCSEDIGKTVFLTREDAESAIAKEANNGK